jgi:SAM-dependent methyltransferase
MTQKKVMAPVDFWSRPDVVSNQFDGQSFLFRYETYLLEQVVNRGLVNPKSVQKIHIMGCGTGREINPLCAIFPASKVIASDISSSMVERCRHNVDALGLADRVTTVVASASEVDGMGADLIVMFDNMLTYVVPAEARHDVMANCRRLLKPGGIVIGVVHSQYGRALKAGYFQLQRLLPFRVEEHGDRLGGFFGKTFKCHYFTRTEVRRLLDEEGFSNGVVLTLKEMMSETGNYKRELARSNNLLFIGVAP